MNSLNGKTIIISRTDSIGDVILSLPLCGYIKEKYKNTKIIFLGRSYTIPIIQQYASIDEVIDWAEIEKLSLKTQINKFRSIGADVIFHVFPSKAIAKISKKAKIPMRIGTSHRLFHLFSCNYRVDFTRKNSNHHESQLNFHLLKPFGLDVIPTKKEVEEYIKYYTPPTNTLPEIVRHFMTKKPVILHPKSQGSALEWPMDKYMELSKLLIQKGKHVIITGTEQEGALIRPFLFNSEHLLDSTGMLDLYQLQVLISRSDALVACSTGPLHIAGFSGIKTIGLFSSRRPIHPGRWAPLGSNVTTLEFDKNCEKCSAGGGCSCLENISPNLVLESIVEDEH